GFHRSVVVIISLDLAANLTAAEVRRVHVRIGQTVAHGTQGRLEVACCNTLVRWPGDICCRDRPGDCSGSCRWAARLAATATQEYHHATSDLARRKVQVGHSKV